MKRLTATLMAALMVLTVFAGVASAAMTVDSVEIRGPVFNGSDISTIVDEQGDGTQVEVNATNFAGFWYDIDEDQATEYIYISNKSSEDGRELAENKGLVYKTYINETGYEAFNGSFPIMGFFADKYVPLTNETPDKLAKLMLDNDDKYTLKVGSSLDLGNGYELTAQQVDVDGKQVWMELTKDGDSVDDNIFDLDGKSEEVWTYEEDVAGEDDVEVLKVKVTSVFQGQVDSLAQIEGLWMIDWDNTMELDSDDERGELERTDSSSSEYLKYYNSDDISLDEDSTIELAEDLTIKVADDSSALRFYLLKEYTEPGTYEVRGTVAVDNTESTWTANDFAGFWYDLDDDQSTETLTADVSSKEMAENKGLVYKTYINETGYEAFNGSFPIMGFFADKYVPLTNETPDKLAKLMLDNDDKYTLKVGSSLDLGNGYELTAQQVDVDGKQVWMELTKDGDSVDDNIFDLDGKSEEVWTYEEDVAGEDDVEVLKVKVTSVFQGQVDSLAQIEGLWMIDWGNTMEIDSDDERGELERTDSSSSDYLKYYNSDDISLDKDETIHIAEEMYFQTADNSTLRYYPFVEMTIEGEEPVIDDTGDEEDETNVTDDETNETEDTTGDVEDTTNETEDTTGDVEDTTNETDTTGDGEDEGAGIPGFEAVFAIAGLLAVAYLVRRN
jgi:S-layer protein (TIGR01567 family)